MLRVLLSFCLSFLCWNAFAAKKSDLVDVDKNSKLSSYFKKINKKMSADSEEIALNDQEVPDTSSETSEEDILLSPKPKAKKSQSSLSPVNKMLISIFGLLVLAVAFFTAVQKMGKKSGHQTIAKNIKILTQKPIGPKKNLVLIRVAGETILLGVTDHNINHIKTLSLMEDELPQFVDPKFSESLQTKIEQTKITDEPEEVDGFAVSRLDDVKNAVTKRFMV
ncbi:MAG: flagellar biosynthetic protein FliO [Pseudomonadota bacterium]